MVKNKYFLRLLVVRKKRKRKRVNKKKPKKQKGGAFGAGMAAGMLAPLTMGTLGKILIVKING